MTTILLGPQRFTTTVPPVVRSLGVDGPIIMVTSGWEEREAQDGELAGHLDGRGVNLRLYQRAVEILAADSAMRAAVREYRGRRAELRAFYAIRLRDAEEALHAVRHRSDLYGLAPSADRAAMQALRDVDDWYAFEAARIVRETAASKVFTASEELARHRSEVADLLGSAAVVLLAGGHVGILMETLRLFEVTLPAQVPVVAWSAGAMAVCDWVVLFHDFMPHGVTTPEVHDHGMARLRGIIALPHARRRLHLEDRARMAALAERFPMHRMLPLDDGTIVRFAGPISDSTGRDEPPVGARFLGTDGTLGTWGAA